MTTIPRALRALQGILGAAIIGLTLAACTGTGTASTAGTGADEFTTRCATVKPTPPWCPHGAAPKPAADVKNLNTPTRWDNEQLTHAALIVAVGQEQGAPRRAIVVALAAAMQESSLRNPAGGDRDSVGLFQQRPSQGWGSRAQCGDPRYATRTFYHTLLSIHGWESMSITRAAQAVQRSALPNAYAKWAADAERLAG